MFSLVSRIETIVRHWAQKKFDITHLHRVTHVIIAVTDLGEKVLTQLKKHKEQIVFVVVKVASLKL